MSAHSSDLTETAQITVIILLIFLKHCKGNVIKTLMTKVDKNLPKYRKCKTLYETLGFIKGTIYNFFWQIHDFEET